MTNTVVSSQELTVVVRDELGTVVEHQPQITTVVTGQLGPRGRPGPSSIEGLTDVDLTNLQGGSLLVYNASTSKWGSTTLLNQQQVDCGEF